MTCRAMPNTEYRSPGSVDNVSTNTGRCPIQCHDAARALARQMGIGYRSDIGCALRESHCYDSDGGQYLCCDFVIGIGLEWRWAKQPGLCLDLSRSLIDRQRAPVPICDHADVTAFSLRPVSGARICAPGFWKTTPKAVSP